MDLIYPMFVLAMWTIIVAFMSGYCRISSAKKGIINPAYFKIMSGYDIPQKLIKIDRNYSNLLEAPILFYTAGVIAIAAQLSSEYLVALAWAHTVLRIIHTLIHTTYNNPMHRFLPFLLSIFCIIAMWVNIVRCIS